LDPKPETQNAKLLVGDIGGTNARLALAEPGSSEPIEERRFFCADYAGFEPLLADFLSANSVASISAGCLAVAGPIGDDGRRAKLTNLPWTIDADALSARFGIGRLCLANDFAAAAMGVTVTPAETLISLQAGQPLPHAPKLVVGAGTGLGMAVLVYQDGRWLVLPGEGGHVGFAPQDEAQARLWQVMKNDYGRVTAERVVSGPGLADIHRILTGKMLTPAAIAGAALEGSDPAARRSVDMFLSAYGGFAGDMALAVMARGGVFLAGGIAGKLLPLLPESPFLTAFNAKAEHAALVAQMPVAVATDPALGLRGAAVLAGN
jgi:glucokinase